MAPRIRRTGGGAAPQLGTIHRVEVEHAEVVDQQLGDGGRPVAKRLNATREVRIGSGNYPNHRASIELFPTNATHGLDRDIWALVRRNFPAPRPNTADSIWLGPLNPEARIMHQETLV